jgi:hypothetical protein
MMSSPVMTVQVIEVIQVVAVRGEGIPGDPCRHATEYFDKCGNFLAEYDPYIESQKEEPK